MALVRNYYELKFGLLCGINQIKFLGTDADWDRLIVIMKQLIVSFDMAQTFTTGVLQPILDVYKNIYNTRLSLSPELKDWWGRVFLHERHSGSGPQETFNGWICQLYRVNESGKIMKKVLEPSDLETTITQANITIINEDQTEEKMKYMTGFIGVLEKDNEYTPCNTWACGMWNDLVKPKFY